MRKSDSGLRAVFPLGNAALARQEHVAPVIASAAMRRLYEVIGRAAPTDLSVLIYGETGS